MYIEIGTLWYLLFTGASPESRRKVAGKLLELNFFWKLEVEEKYDVMVVSGILLRLANPSIYSISMTPHFLQKSDNHLQESSHLQFFMSNNTFTPSISCFLNQFVGFFSENRNPKSLSFDSEFWGWKLEKTGFYGFRLVVRDIAMRHCQNGIVARQGRTVLEAFCAFFFCATMTCDYDILS